MKSSSPALVLVATVLAIAACQTTIQNSSPTHPLQGNWEMVSGRFTNPEGQVTEFAAPQFRALKVIGPERFVFITTREDGTFVRAAGGRYTVQGNRYTEHIDQTSGVPMRGDSYEFDWRVEGDTWYHNGSHHAGKIEEIWRRVR